MKNLIWIPFLVFLQGCEVASVAQADLGVAEPFPYPDHSATAAEVESLVDRLVYGYSLDAPLMAPQSRAADWRAVPLLAKWSTDTARGLRAPIQMGNYMGRNLGASPAALREM